MKHTQNLVNKALTKPKEPVMKISVRRIRKGMTLIEVMIGLVIMAMLGVSLAGTLMLAERNSRQAQIRATALGVAKRQLEIVTASSFGNIKRVNGAAFTIPSNIISQFSGGTTGTQLQGIYTAELVKDNLMKVTVRVKWKNAARSNTTPGSEVVITQLVASNNEVALRDTEDETELFYNPPPPPPPPPPTTGGSTGGHAGPTAGGTTGSDPGTSTTGSTTGGTNGGTTGGTTGATTGGSSWGSYGGKWQFPR